jgi:DNA-directed RNA polymerase subunit RPC12/RpoP|tara:strand:- start:106 stop:288 length:183 start_codon:yes stop_codon:yes gene_type:complete
MAEKVQKTCSNCETKYTITWDIEEQDLEPLTCPFCGFEVDNEQEEVEWVNKDEDEDDNWN